MIALKILIAIDIVLCSIILSQFIGISKKHYLQSNQVLIYFTGFLLVHLVYVFISKLFFPTAGWVENSAPFGLAHGPFAYLSTRSYIQSRGLQRRDIWFFLPYLIFLIVHIGLLVFGVNYNSEFAEWYLKALYGLTGLLFMVFGVWSWLLLRSNEKFKKISHYLFIIVATTCIVFFGVLFLQTQFVGESMLVQTQNEIGGILIYAFFLTLLLILAYHVRSLKLHSREESNEPAGEENNERPMAMDFSEETKQAVVVEDRKSQSSRYQKSGLTDEDLDRYEKKLDDYMANTDAWLQTGLSLTTLARELKMPEHHLTQLINIRKGVNFNEFLNGYRIEYSCLLLDQTNDKISIEDIAYQSGFNSKTTYYRWFKKMKNMTPLEYLDKNDSELTS